MMLARAPSGGINEYGHLFKGGEFLPFYIPRDFMPQVDEKDYPDLLVFLKEKGVIIDDKMVQPGDLRAHQRVNFSLVRTMDDCLLSKPCLVSMDAFILDGNHRWMAHVVRRIEPVPVMEISMPFDPAIDMLFQFPRTYSYGDGQRHAISR